MEVFVNLKDNGGYMITHNDKVIINTSSKPIRTYHEVIDSLFPNAKVYIDSETCIDNDSKDIKNSKETFENNINLDEFNPFKDTVEFGKYKETFAHVVFEDDEFEEYNEEPIGKNGTTEPIDGDVDVPSMGDIIYIDGITQTLCKITGGLATVLSVKETTDPVVVDTMIDAYDEYSEEYSEKDICENNVLVELEEFPGTFVSWTMLKEKQDELSDKYNYTTAKKISLLL